MVLASVVFGTNRLKTVLVKPQLHCITLAHLQADIVPRQCEAQWTDFPLQDSPSIGHPLLQAFLNLLSHPYEWLLDVLK